MIETAPNPLNIRWLGKVSYNDALAVQKPYSTEALKILITSRTSSCLHSGCPRRYIKYSG